MFFTTTQLGRARERALTSLAGSQHKGRLLANYRYNLRERSLLVMGDLLISSGVRLQKGVKCKPNAAPLR